GGFGWPEQVPAGVREAAPVRVKLPYNGNRRAGPTFHAPPTRRPPAGDSRSTLRVARQFYLEGVSKVDIADRLGISRFRVARLLDSARDAGMVRIEIGLPGGSLDAGLSVELCSAFGLSNAFVFNFPDDEQTMMRR